MSDQAVARRSAGLFARAQDWAEELIYRLNEADHWIFRLYDRLNEWFAALRYRGLRRRAASVGESFETRDGATAWVRFLLPEDEEEFATLLAGLEPPYLPPHPVDRDSARAALHRRSYLPWGIFVGERLVGYLLVRLFIPGRGVTGIWTLPETHNSGIGQRSLIQSVRFLRNEGLPDYCTIPIGNDPSLRIAELCGYTVLRTNKRFNVLLITRDV